jgi:hypothetical protein
MSITLGLPNNLPNDFNLFGEGILGINIAVELCGRAFMDYESGQQIENSIGDNLGLAT